MNYETGKNLDLTSAVSLYPTALTAEAQPDRPWSTPAGLSLEGSQARANLLDTLIAGVGGMLDVLQPAHRAGKLHAGDIHRMQQLELWYSELQAEKEHMPFLRQTT